MLTTQQTTDLQTWFEHQEEALPENLANVLIEDCLKELKNNLSCRIILDQGLLRKTIIRQKDGEIGFGFGGRKLEELEKDDQVIILLKLLSQIDGKAVIPFLDVESPELREVKRIMFGSTHPFASEIGGEIIKIMPKTLDHLLYREFTESMRIGKTFDEALEIITKIYLVQRYV